jgi:hypothetical protein
MSAKLSFEDRQRAMMIVERMIEEPESWAAYYVAMERLLQEATEGEECFEHNRDQTFCSCGAAICPGGAEPKCLLGRVDRMLGHREGSPCRAGKNTTAPPV